MTDNKKYIINVGDQSEVWDTDMYNAKQDSLFAKYNDASVWEMEDVEGFDEDPTEKQYMVSVGNQSEIWDADMVKEKGAKLTEVYPDAHIQRISYKDYWGEQAEANRAKRKELAQPDEERNAKLAELGYYDDMSEGQRAYGLDAPSMIGLKPLSSVIELNSVSGQATYLDPRVQEFFAEDSAYTDKMSQIAQLDAEYDVNPSVIAQREWEAKMLEERKAYAGKLEEQIKADMESDVDVIKAARGGSAKRQYGSDLASDQMSYLLDIVAGDKAGSGASENEKSENYNSALKFLEKAKIARDIAGKGFGGAVVDWAKEGVMDLATQDDIETYNEIGNILTRLEKEVGNLKAENLTEEVFDKYLSKDEQALIKAFYEYNSAMGEAQQDMSRAYKGGKIFAESVPFMLEFLITGGVYKGAGRAATSWMGKSFAKWIAKSAKGTAVRTAKKLATKAISGAVKAAVGTAARTLISPGTYDRMAEASINIDKDGHLNKAKESAIAFADMYIENLSEISGALIGDTLGLFAKGIGKGAGWVIGKTPLSKVGALLANNAFMQKVSALGKGVKDFMPKLKALGFHGLPEEVGEEFIGNTIRDIANIQPGALKEMVSDDNFGAMLIGFTPMTLLGVAGGAYTLGVVNAKAAQLGKDLREKLGSAYTEEELDHMMGVIQNAQTAEEIQKALKPMAMAAVNSFEKGVISKEQMTEQIEMLYQYGGFMAQNNALVFGKKAQDRQMMDAKREEFTNKYGRFWQEDQNETVQIATLNNGSTVFVVSTPAEDGKITTIDVNTGKKGFANVSDIATQEVEGEQIQPTNSMTMDAFLNGQIATQRKTAEETRMNNERNAQIEALASQITPGTRINLGTEGSPIYVFAKRTNKNGVVVVDETGMESLLGWEQAAYALGQPIKVETDQQKLDAEISDRLQRMAERRMQRAVTPAAQATTEAAEGAAEVVAQEQQNIPLNEDGTVNEALFWTQDPEGYVKWNDEQNKDGGQDSLRQIAISKQELFGMLQEVAAGQNTSNPTMRKAAEKQVAAIAEKIARLEALEMSYADALAEEQESIKQTAATPTATMNEEQLEQMDTQYQGILGKTRIQSERVRVMQEYLDKISEESFPVIVLTRSNYAEKMKAEGCEESRIKIVERYVKLGKTIGGFTSNGKLFLMEEGLPNINEARVTYVHERQHVLNTQNPKFVQAIVEAAGDNRDMLVEWVKSFVGNEMDAYKSLTPEGLADELICRCMEIAYTSEEFSVDLQSKGIPSEVISIITEIDNEQRSSTSLANARRRGRRNENANVNIEGGVEENGRDSGQVSGGILGNEAVGSSGSSNGGAQIGEGGEPAEVISDDEEQIEEPADEDILTEEGFEVDEQNEDVRFSIRYLPTPEQREGLINSIVKITGQPRDIAERWLDSELSLASIVLNDREYLDYAPDSKYKAIKDNSDYPQGTVDFNNICRKRKDFTRMYTRLQRAYPNRIFTAENLADIRTIMSEDGLVVACGLCYVEDRRQKLGEVADEFIKDLQDGFKSYGKKNATKRANAEKFRSFVGDDTYIPSIYDLITLEGSDKLHDEHKGIWDAFGAYNRARGQQTQNTFQGYAEYKREILTWSDAKVKKVNSLGGLRIFSYSDFEAHHLLDIIQIIIDCAARGVMIQGYTKVPEFARVVEKTGIKLNRSLIPLGDTGIVDGKLAYDPVEGIDINDPNFLESNDNVGNILIGINDEQIRMAMADPFIHYIIPYHARQAGNIRAKLNVGAWTNYIDTQNERKMSDGKRVDKNINIYTDVLNESITNDREFVEKYLEVCREKGYIPKFDQFLDKDAEGNYVYTPGYYKFLVDFKLFDEAGNILPQKSVVAQFDDAFNAQVLLDYAREERETAGASMNSTYDKIVETLDLGEPIEGEDVRFSIKKGEESTEDTKKVQARNIESRSETNNIIDRASALVSGTSIAEQAKQRRRREKERLELTKDLYSRILNNQFDDVTLRLIDKYIEDATPENPYGSRISQRLPQEMERGLFSGERASAVNALFSRVSEGAVSPSDRKSQSGKKKIEETKKNLLKNWAKATGMWYDNLSDVKEIADTTPFDEGTESKVYASTIDGYIIKTKKGKPYGKRFRPDIDDLSLFNYIFPDTAYHIIGYGDFGDGISTIVAQPAVVMSDENVTTKERVGHMASIGMKPINKDKTAFSNGKIVASDIQGKNIVKDASGNIRVIDADMKLHTTDVGGEHVIPDVETDTKDKSVSFRVRSEEERDKLFEDAKAHYGVTKNFNAAGYMLPDGSLLDYSEANDGGDPNSRSLDHRDIEGVIMDNGVEYDSRWMYIADFMNEGAIRLLPESAGINMIQAPTEEQRKKIFDFIYKYNGEIILEINDERLNSIVYMEYDRRTSPSRIFRDIDGYFNEGIVPQQDVRFRVANENQAIFVSNAAKAVEGIKMDKATPEQWLKMIEKNGGLKAGEDKWMGLSDWLKASDKKTLTKAEVLDYINENMIIIEEQHYSNQLAYDNNSRLMDEKYPGWRDAFSFEWDDYRDAPNADILDAEEAATLYNKYNEDKVEVDEDGEIVDDTDRNKVILWGEDLAKILFGLDGNAVRPIHDTREVYTTKGLINNHEIALTVPTIESWGKSDMIHFGDAGEGRAIAWIRFGDITIKNKESDEALYNQSIDELNAFWDSMREKYGNGWQEYMSEEEKLREKEIVAKYRQLRKDNYRKVLVIDEIQSKRHQEGREKGYRVANINKWLKDNNVEVVETGEFFEFIKNGETDRRFSKGLMQYDIEKAKRLYVNGFAKTDVPDAPFDKNWHELAMKRMLRYAAENGYDIIAWTKGDQQAERYNIGKVVASVDYRLNDDGTYHVDTMGHRGYQMEEIPTTFNSEAELAEIFGKENARKMAENLENDKKTITEADKEIGDIREWFSQNHKTDETDLNSLFEIAINNPEQSERWNKLEVKKEEARRGHSLSETDFRIGGEGMKGFYDKILPAFMNKYGKKWGVKVEDIELNGLENGLTMHSVPVTEEMKASVMEGQVMFRVRGENESAIDFCVSVVRDIKSNYRIDAKTRVAEVNEENARVLGYKDGVIDDIAIYLPDYNMIVIFAHEELDNSLDIENAVFHEINHKYYDNPSIGDWLWEYSDGVAYLADLKREIIETYSKKGFSEAEQKEELYCETMAQAMSLGTMKVFYEKLPQEYKATVDKVLNETRYDKEKEFTERIRRSAESNSGADSGSSELSRQKQESNGLQSGDEKQTGEDAARNDRVGTGAGTRLRVTEITPEIQDELDAIKASAIVMGYFMKAPNGKDTNLTEEQWLMVRTKSFREWFGDWINDPENASKVVDENGEPRIMHHGSDWQPLSESAGDAVFNMNDGILGKGAYFASNLMEATMYAEMATGLDTSIDGNLENRQDEYVSDYFLNIRDKKDIFELGDNDIIAVAKSPSQIKSATDNTGEFSEGEGDIRFKVVTDPAKIEELESGEKIKVYRAMQLIDGKLYPPMSAKVDGQLREPIELGQWEEAEERPDLADNKGYFKLDKGNKKSLKARYNPYFHTSYTPLNDQFSEAQDRPNLVTVEVEIPVSELTSGYKADKAKDSVGEKEWKAGVIQGKLSGTRKVILSRWDKPIRIVPDSEVADVIVKMFEGKDIVMPSNVVTPSLRAELESRGVPFVETDNQGKKLTNIAEMTTPIWSSKGTFANLAEAEEWAHKNLQGKSRVNRYTGERISIGSNSISKMLSPKSQKQSSSISAHLAALKSVLDFIKTGIPAEVHADQEGRDFNVLRLYNAIEIDNKLYRVKSTVRKVRQGDKFYTYEVQEMELIEERWSSQKGEADNPRNPDSPINSITGAKLLKGVKKSNSNENILPESENVSFRVTGTPTEDVVAEGVSLSPAQIASLAGDIFAALPEDVRKKITDGLNGNILGLQDAILQIPTSLATKENWNDEDIKLANAVRTVLQEAIDKKSTTSRPITTKEALWMFYNSTNKVKDLVDAASRAFVAHNLGFGQASMQRKQEVDDFVRFRTASNGAIDAATDMYNYETSLWNERLKESWLDMNQSVISLQNAMAEASGMPIEPWENIEFALNRLSSKSYADKKKYLRDFLMPMWDTILDIVKHDHVSIEEIERYMMLKHGLERNKKFASRDAKEFYRTMYDLVAERMKNQSHAQQVVALSEAKKRLADIDAQIAVASSSQLPRLNEARARAQYDVDVADLVLRGNEQQNEAELQAYYDAIDNEADPKYREFREKDYGGLTSMFVDTTNVKRSDYKSEEAYQRAVLAATTPRYNDVAAMESAAEREVSLFENKVYMYRALWDRVNAATKETLRHQYERGMITLEQYEAVRDMFEFYVPLRGFADNTAEDMYSYYMTNSAGGFAQPILGAKGRKTRAESPLGWIGTMAESAIQADNKNEVKMCLYYMTLRRPDQNLLTITETWYEYTGQKDANGKKIFKAAYPPAIDRTLNADELRQHMEDWENDMKQKQSRGEAYKGSQRVDLKGSVIFQDEKEEKEHIVRVKVAGKDYSILINGNPRAAQAINGLLNPDANVGPVAQWIGDARRSLSALLTSYSPLFWVANFQRDLLSSTMRVSEADGWDTAMKYLANRRKAWRVASYIYKYDAGTLGDSYYEKLYKEFAENGGITGYTSLTTNKEYENLLEKYANNVDKHVLNALKGAWDKFMGFGEAIEQVSRFAAFITAREEGKSIEDAINAAKEVSVNFNRKGSAKPISLDELDKLRTKDGKKLNKAQRVAALVLSAMPGPMKYCYYFVNASIQALSSSAKLAKKSPGKATTWVGMYMGTSIALAMLNYLLSDDDDDEYLNLPDYLRHSTALVKVADGYYFKWSIPQEMRPFYAWADILVRKMMGKMPHKSGADVGKEMALAASQWLPVNPFDGEDPLLSLVPDFLSPLAEIKANTNAFGGKIYDDMAFKPEGVVKKIPAYRKGTEKTGAVYVDLAEFLNDVSGGDESRTGWININPAIMEHLIEGYGGGIYDFAKMMVSIPSMIISDDPVQVKEIPFVNKVILSVDETNMYSHTNEAFSHYKNIADNAKRVEKEYRESDDPSRANAYREEEDWRIYLLYKKYEKDFQDVKERLDNAVDKDEEYLLKQEQNALREMFLDNIAKGDIPEVTFQIREDIKRIDKEIKAVKKPVTDANRERLEKRSIGDVDGMLKAIEKRDSLKETPEYQRAEELSVDLNTIKQQLKELDSIERGSQRDSIIGELQRNYDNLIRKMK